MKESFKNDISGVAERIAYLIAGYIRKTLTEKEHDELDDWVNEDDSNMKLFEDLTDEQNIESNLKWLDDINTEAVYEKLKQEGKFELPSKKSNSIFWIAAVTNKPTDQTGLTVNNDTLKNHVNGVLLTLENGKSIDLSKVKNGLLESGIGIKENDSVLNFDNTSVAQNHILKTPTGKTFQLKLPDGTNVWLNSSSSLKFPTLFTGNERIVTLEGEGYFEVAKNVQKPFKVLMTDSSLITVLGTHFNVNAYKNESKEVTLIEGSVNVSKAQSSVLLTPGTLVEISNSGLGKVKKADVESIMGWKSGLFVFKDANIKNIMSQLEQWYNIKTVYNGQVRHQFNATFSRNENLDQILKLLELNGFVNFKTENNIVYVSP